MSGSSAASVMRRSGCRRSPDANDAAHRRPLRVVHPGRVDALEAQARPAPSKPSPNASRARHNSSARSTPNISALSEFSVTSTPAAAQPGPRVVLDRVDDADRHVRRRAGGHRNPPVGHLGDERRIVEQAHAVVDPLDPEHLDAGADVGDRALLAEVHRRVEPEPAGPAERLGQRGQVDADARRRRRRCRPAGRGRTPSARSISSSAAARPGRLVHVEDHPAHDAMVCRRIGDARGDALPDRRRTARRGA